jgi:uncharacterized protein YdcH (DUF465 family)
MSTTPWDFREQLLASNAEFQELALRKSQYDAKIEELISSPFFSSEDLVQQIELKKLRLRVKDQMELIFNQAWQQHTQPRSGRTSAD